MERLGYPRFATLGGDWGATVSNYIGLDFPEHLYGLYLTMVAAGPPEGSDGSELRENEKEWVAANAAFFAEESGYLQIQATRPQTLAYGADRFARRSGRVDRREAAGVERLRRRPRVGHQPGRHFGQHHPLLGDRYGQLGRPHLPRSNAGRAVGADRFAHRRAHGLCHLPQGDGAIAEGLGRAGLGRPALDGDAAGRPFRRPRGTRAAGSRCTSLLRGPPPLGSARAGRRPRGTGPRIRPGVECGHRSRADRGHQGGYRSNAAVRRHRGRGVGGSARVAPLVGLAHRGASRPVDGEDAVRRHAAAGRAPGRRGLVVHRRAQDDVVPGHPARHALREEARDPSHVGDLRGGGQRRLRPPCVREGQRGRRRVGERDLSLRRARPVRCAQHRCRDEGHACLQRLDRRVLCE